MQLPLCALFRFVSFAFGACRRSSGSSSGGDVDVAVAMGMRDTRFRLRGRHARSFEGRGVCFREEGGQRGEVFRGGGFRKFGGVGGGVCCDKAGSCGAVGWVERVEGCEDVAGGVEVCGFGGVQEAGAGSFEEACWERGAGFGLVTPVGGGFRERGFGLRFAALLVVERDEGSRKAGGVADVEVRRGAGLFKAVEEGLEEGDGGAVVVR